MIASVEGVCMLEVRQLKLKLKNNSSGAREKPQRSSEDSSRVKCTR